MAKRGKQSKKHFSTRNGAAESSYRPLDLRGERQALGGQTDICMQPARSLRKFSQWNLGLNNARVSNLQVEYNGITLNSVTLDQPIVSAEFEQGGYLQTMNGRLKKI